MTRVKLSPDCVRSLAATQSVLGTQNPVLLTIPPELVASVVFAFRCNSVSWTNFSFQEMQSSMRLSAGNHDVHAMSLEVNTSDIGSRESVLHALAQCSDIRNIEQLSVGISAETNVFLLLQSWSALSFIFRRVRSLKLRNRSTAESLIRAFEDTSMQPVLFSLVEELHLESYLANLDHEDQARLADVLRKRWSRGLRLKTLSLMDIKRGEPESDMPIDWTNAAEEVDIQKDEDEDW